MIYCLCLYLTTVQLLEAVTSFVCPSPLQDAALQSLKSLNRNDVVEVRAMQRPPEGVKLVIEAVCIMKGLKAKKVAGDKVGSYCLCHVLYVKKINSIGKN